MQHFPFFFNFVKKFNIFLSAQRRKRERGGASPLQDELQDDEQLDEETQHIDCIALEKIKHILIEHEEEMNNFENKKEGRLLFLVFCE